MPNRIILPLLVALLLCITAVPVARFMLKRQPSHFTIATTTIIHAPAVQVHEAIGHTTTLEYWLPWLYDATQATPPGSRSHFITEPGLGAQALIAPSLRDVLGDFSHQPYSILRIGLNKSHGDIVWLNCEILLEPTEEGTTRIHAAAAGKRLSRARAAANFTDQPAAYEKLMAQGLTSFKAHVEASSLPPGTSAR